MEVVPELTGDGVEVIESTTIRADPKFFIRCFGDAKHIIVAERIIIQCMSVMYELAGISFMDIQATGECAYPHIADVVHVGCVDGVVAETGGVDVIVQILPECIGVGIVDIDTGIFQCYPQFVAWIFTYSEHRVAGDAFVVTGAVFEVMKGTARGGIVHPVQPPAIRADPETLAAVLVQADQLVVAKGGRIIFAVTEMNKCAALFIEEVQSIAVSAQPQVLTAVDKHITDIIAAKACGIFVEMCELIEFVAIGDEAYEALIFGAYPNATFFIFNEAGDEVAGNGCAAGVLFEGSELVFSAIVSIKPSSPGRNPDIAAVVFYDVGDKVVADGSFIRRVVAIDADLVAIIFVETVTGAEPDETTAVLQDVEDIVLGEAVNYIQVLEFKTRLLCSSQATERCYQQGCQEPGFKLPE